VVIDPLEALIDAFYPTIQDLLQDAMNRSFPLPLHIIEPVKPTSMANDEAITR
jgi:hypothetical protein